MNRNLELPDDLPEGFVFTDPAGLTAAYYLTIMGHEVTVYDMWEKMGGMLRYGIPQYRLPKEVLEKEIALIEKAGVKLALFYYEILNSRFRQYR